MHLRFYVYIILYPYFLVYTAVFFIKYIARTVQASHSIINNIAANLLAGLRTLRNSFGAIRMPTPGMLYDASERILSAESRTSTCENSGVVQDLPPRLDNLPVEIHLMIATYVGMPTFYMIEPTDLLSTNRFLDIKT